MLIQNFDLSLAPGWLENVEMAKTERTPMYGLSLTLPMAGLHTSCGITSTEPIHRSTR